jgi:hypothetical protein
MPPPTRARKSPSKTTRRRPTAATRTTSRPAPEPAEPSPTPGPSPTVSAAIPGFARLEDPLAPTMMESESPAANPPPAPPALDEIGAAVGPELDDAGHIPAFPTARRARFKLPATPFKLRAGTVDKATRDGVLELIGGALELIGRALQARAVPPAKYGPNDAWIPDAADQETIAGPIANMTARRIPTGLGAESDVADILTLTAGTAGYAIKNSRKTALYKRAAAEGAWSSAEGTAPDAEHQGAAGMNGTRA